MLMAVFLYRPIYKKMFVLADTTHQKENVDLKRIEKSSTVNPAGDCIITMKTTQYYEADNKVIQTSVSHVPREETERQKFKTQKRLFSGEMPLGNDEFGVNTTCAGHDGVWANSRVPGRTVSNADTLYIHVVALPYW